ncbi:MAG: acetoacetate metabolism regulatory protein AtoC [Methanocella sp. PtaU1.Bin125]|nr:MAG: acetoacetate metabolism regulatory protein AtoC [Methanocella sp. PtaU1.Bin125]
MNEDIARSCPVCSAIVEDEEDLIWIYRRIFARIGVPVSFVAADGTDALTVFREAAPKPQVVLMDYRLPGLSGLDLTKEMIKSEPGTRVIFLSGDGSVKDEAFKAGAYRFLEKPAGLKDIITAIESALVVTAGTEMPRAHGANCEIGSL